MKQEKFHVYFNQTEYISVRAFSGKEAKILAQAERIKEGKDFYTSKIILLKGILK